MDFCKEFNARTAHIEPGVPIPTLITVQPDRSFTFVTKTPPATYFLKKAAGIEKGAGRPGHEITGTITLKHVYEIARIKAIDEHMKILPLESVARMIVGSARSLGIQVVPWSTYLQCVCAVNFFIAFLTRSQITRVSALPCILF